MTSVSTGVTDDRERDERGQFSETVTPDAIESYLREHHGASTSELADAFDVSGETIRRKCRNLKYQGRVRIREVGHAMFWQPVDE